MCWEVPLWLQLGKARTCSQNGGEGAAMACLTNKDMSKEPFATLAWAQFKREIKKILDGKKNEITVCQREIDRSGREGGRFLLCFCLLVSKQAFFPGQGKQK